MNRPIAEVEYALLVKFAASYLLMLEGSDADRAALEVIYKIGNGGIEDWVNERIESLLTKARKLQRDHGPFPVADAIMWREPWAKKLGLPLLE